jgi:uncharacterized protein
VERKKTGLKEKVALHSMNSSWTGKTALITGASSGIGASIAEKLSSEGIRVILVSRNISKLNTLKNKINSSCGQACCYACDLTISENRIHLFEQIKNELGIPDILINNAGIGWYGYFYQMPWKVADNILSLNIVAPTHLTSLFIPFMLKLQKGRIINIGSVVGKLPEQGVALYSASKGYLDSFTKTIFRELRGTNLSASIVRAGPVKTDFFDTAAEFKGGSRIPAEIFAISPERVAEKVWSLIEHPRRYVYVPFYTFFSPLLETLFSWVIDFVGPVLLKRSIKNQ